MSTSLLDEPVTQASSPSQTLRTTMAAMRLSFTWFGTRKSLSPQQMAQAADTFGAERCFLSAGKKLLDTRDPTFRAVTAVRGQASSYANDYPLSLSGLFDMTWDFPSVEPPQYLQQLNPSLYEQECNRVRSRFDEAVQMAEQAFIEELSQLVSHLTERLGGQEDGRPKIFRDTAVGNLREFFERFRTLNIRSNEQLDELVDRVQQVVRGVKPQQLRDRQSLRQQITTQLSSVQSSLDRMLVDRPRRNILRRAR
ncbi:MAG: hypothetical protein ACC628_18040 [Pirellulaceae bacterium]